MGMDTKYYERIAEEVAEKEIAEEEEAKRREEEKQRELIANRTMKSPKKLSGTQAGQRIKPATKSRSPGLAAYRPLKPTSPAVLTLKRPLNGVKWAYIPKPVRELQPPPVIASWDPPSANDVAVFRPGGPSTSKPQSATKDWYKGILTDEELDALEHPKPKVRNSNYTNAANKRKHHHASGDYNTSIYLLYAQFRCPSKNGQFEDPSQCDKFYDCVDGVATEKLCPDGLVFDPLNRKTNKCDQPFNVDCGDRIELQPPKSNHLCPRRNGYFAHQDESVCNIFYNCIEGEANQIVCPPGLHFDEYSGTCVWPDSAGRTNCGEPEDSKLMLFMVMLILCIFQTMTISLILQ
ncbi:unnamed protein product [Nesidiocoris tenuis]|uniref:Chitin-binding type-2 domain-containing protein n=1 Tax=Nesidiocoris tenuis TaxID=355587 RepID=A0A6H5HK13_9HEMI|nr:unnamed protein product [Nesidiocoris tenuis]